MTTIYAIDEEGNGHVSLLQSVSSDIIEEITDDEQEDHDLMPSSPSSSSLSSTSSSSTTLLSSPFEGLLGPTLYQWSSTNPDQAEAKSTSNLLADKKVVAIYFSAGWCGPCRQFTPILSKFYSEMNKKGKKFEVVFISRDRSQEEFAEV